MKAMILAAGLGTRLRPLTDARPKALVEVAGHTLLEIALTRLRAFDVREVIVNTHYYADMIQKYLEANSNFGMRIEISREEILLDTGGGLKRAAWFFRETDGSLQEPFILHNVDVISSIDLGRMMRFHLEQGAIATLAVQDRESSRYLLFDAQGRLGGRSVVRNIKAELAEPGQQLQRLAFSGIHVISPSLLTKLDEEGAFSIISSYVRLAAQGEKVIAFRADGFYWRDLGRPENIEQAALDLKEWNLSTGNASRGILRKF
jgi:mannose-1-phosphate guanylyltransferase